MGRSLAASSETGKQSFDVIVLGAGAAGLFCAFHAARRGRKVAVIEHNREPGRKILISGGGRCNFTNTDTRAECFLSANPHFAKSALASYRPRDFIELVERHGIAWHEKKLGQLFCDGSARQIVELLLTECRESGAVVRCNERIKAVRREGGFEIETTAGLLAASSLVVATGGPSIPKMGATGFGYDLARQFGLNVIFPRPALVPLTFQPAWPDLAGVSFPARVSFGAQTFEENVLFTHRGLSGPAILQISSYWQPGRTIRIDAAPRLDLEAELLGRKQVGERGTVRTALAKFLPERFAAQLAPDDEPLFRKKDAYLRQLIEKIHRWDLSPAGTEGFDKAEVCAGGVDTAELSSQSMEAKRVPGLYFIGECVDVTGWLGGYNFQWAWASAFAAAKYC